MERLWVKMDAVPMEEPGPELDRKFRVMLDTYSHGYNTAPENGTARHRFDSFFGALRPGRPVFQAAAAIVILALGMFLGRSVEYGKQREIEVASLKKEVAHMRELVTISLLSQSSAIDRLQGVTMSRNVGNPDDRLLDALVNTLDTDPNVNVRLAAVDALGRYCDREWIRTALVTSLGNERSPLVQISLINLLVEIRELRAREALESLIEDQNSLEPVRKRARTGLEYLI